VLEGDQAFLDRTRRRSVLDQCRGDTLCSRQLVAFDGEQAGKWSQPDEKIYAAWGSHDQFIIVIPDDDIIVVLTAAKPDADAYIPPTDLADYIAKSVRADKDLPPDPKGTARLQAAFQSAGTERRDDVDEPPPLAAEISGKPYDFGSNPLRLESLSLNLTGPTPTWSVSRRKSASDATVRTVTWPISLKGVFSDGPSQEGAPLAKGRWLSPTSFEAQRRVLGEGVTDTWVFEFQGAAIDLHFENNEGLTADVHGTMRQ
jgi:hypothetical protein